MLLKWRRGGKLACPLLSKLARRERICLQRRLENFPGDRNGPIECLTREYAVISTVAGPASRKLKHRCFFNFPQKVKGWSIF